MRPQQNRRIRGRGNNNNNNGNNRRGPNPLTRNYESNGPDVKIRGNAQHIADKYAALARDVQAAGDRVMAENYLQHAEHYMRIILSAQPQFVPPMKAEPLYDEDETSNVVDLPLIESDGGEENLLQLVINRDVDESVNEEDSDEKGNTVQNGVNIAVAPPEEKPKIERARRMARRRLSRQALPESTDASSLPSFITQVQDGLQQEPGESSAISQQDDAQTEVKKPTRRVTKASAAEGEEKPRRKRRTTKTADEETSSLAIAD